MRMFLALSLVLFSFTLHAAPVKVSSAYSVMSADELIYATGNGYDITLPPCSMSNDGEPHTIAHTGSAMDSVNIVPSSGDTISRSGGFGLAGFQANKWHCDADHDDWVGVGFWLMDFDLTEVEAPLF